MIRTVSLCCIGVAAASVAYVYYAKHQTQLVDREIGRVNQAIEAARERTGVLRAEWTWMNDPERLRELANQHLKLVTVAPKQFTTLADLPNRLPPPRALPVGPEMRTDEPAPEPNDPTPIADAPLPLPPPAPPEPPAQQTASAVGTPMRATPAKPVAAVPAPTSVAHPALAPAGTPALTPIPASAVAPAPRPAGGVSPTVAPAPPAPSVSALGMARGIVAPPVPVGTDLRLMRGN